ncbi:Uncharacterised protein [Mycobacteroides abscessus subsp. abscessus]|nr:Uncharacterised protein [Mycobacteroides abscessus subsp. abscessus]
MFERDGQGDRSRARAEVDDERGCPIVAVREVIEDLGDEEFGLRSGDEDAGTDPQAQAAEVGDSGEVLERDAARAFGDEAGETGGDLGRHGV